VPLLQAVAEFNTVGGTVAPFTAGLQAPLVKGCGAWQGGFTPPPAPLQDQLQNQGPVPVWTTAVAGPTLHRPVTGGGADTTPFAVPQAPSNVQTARAGAANSSNADSSKKNPAFRICFLLNMSSSA
jgi:hypothetical protein